MDPVARSHRYERVCATCAPPFAFSAQARYNSTLRLHGSHQALQTPYLPELLKSDSVQLCALPPSLELKAVRSLTIREGKGAFGLDEGTNAQRVELYLARARERQKARARAGANTPMTVASKATSRRCRYGVKRLSACDGCLGDYRR